MTPVYETILVETGPVARVVLNRPRARNSQNRQMLRDLDAAFAELAADDRVRVIVLSGAGEHFSAGHDVKEIQAGDVSASVAQARRFSVLKDLYLDTHLRWRNLLKPTIAMVQGYCIFGGWMLASAMDFIFAADDARFLAYPAPADYWSVVWELGPRKTLEILYENRFVLADEAGHLGLVNRVLPRHDLERETLAYAARVAENDPAMLRNLKLHVLQTVDGMGFTQSVNAAFHGFRNVGALDPAAPRVERDGGQVRFRGVAPALDRLRRQATPAPRK